MLYLLNLASRNHCKCLTSILNAYISSFLIFLNAKDECSFVSLRDVERAMQVMVWFFKHVNILGRLMRRIITEQRREEGEEMEDDDGENEEEVIIVSHFN